MRLWPKRQLETTSVQVPDSEVRDWGGGFFYDPNAIPPPGIEAGSAAGLAVTQRTSLQLSAVWACVNLISSTVASLPWACVREDDGVLTEAKPQMSWVRQPHPGMTRMDWLTQVAISMLLHGQFYALVVQRDGLGFPMSLLPMDPANVWPLETSVAGITSYRTAVTVLQAEDVVHVRNLSLPGSFVGMSAIDYGRTVFGLGLAADDYGSRYFSEGTSPSGILASDEDLDPADARQLQIDWEINHNRRSRRPAMLTGGLKWQPLAVRPDEAQFLETRNFNAVDISRFFGVPPHLIGAVDKTTSWGSGIEEQTLGFLTFNLRSFLSRIEEGLLPYVPRTQTLLFDVAGLMRGRTTERYQGYRIGLGANVPWLTVNEVRRDEGLAPIAGGDKLSPVPGIIAPDKAVKSTVQEVEVDETGVGDTSDSTVVD